MTDWVQNCIIIPKYKKALAGANTKEIILKVQDPIWMAEAGFRSEDFFSVELKNNGSLEILSDTKWDPPIELFEEWRDLGLIFNVYYCDVANWTFVGKWFSSGVRVHIDCSPNRIKKDLKIFIRNVPSDLRKRFDFQSHIEEEF